MHKNEAFSVSVALSKVCETVGWIRIDLHPPPSLFTQQGSPPISARHSLPRLLVQELVLRVYGESQDTTLVVTHSIHYHCKGDGRTVTSIPLLG